MLISYLDIPCATMFSIMNRSKTSLPPGPVARGRMNALGSVVPLYSRRECGVLDLLGDMTLHQQQICRIEQKGTFYSEQRMRESYNFEFTVVVYNTSTTEEEASYFWAPSSQRLSKCCVHVTPFYDTVLL